MSESKAGLQTSLNLLSDYCKEWQLKVNEKKTKSMIVQTKNRNRCTEDFIYGDTKLEQVKTYKYLGITFSENTCMSLAQEILWKKVIKAYYAMQNILFQQDFEYNKSHHIFFCSCRTNSVIWM